MENDFLLAPLEVKFATDAAAGTFSGYGSIFGNTDLNGDVVQKGAFKKTIATAKKSGAWPVMLLQHGGFGFMSSVADEMPIGIWTDLSEDDKGLAVEGKIAVDTVRGAEVHALLKMTPRPALSGLSIGYVAKQVVFGTKPDEPRRILKEVDLFEISLVTMPANPLAQVEAVKRARRHSPLQDFARRLRDGEPPQIKEFEDILREAGVPKALAVQIASVGYAKAVRSESDGVKASLAALQDAVRGFLPSIP